MPKELTENLRRIAIKICKELDIAKRAAALEFTKKDGISCIVISDILKDIIEDCDPGKFKFDPFTEGMWSIEIDKSDTEIYQLMGTLATVLSGKNNYTVLRKIQNALDKKLREIKSEVLKEVVCVTSSYNESNHLFRATLQIDGMPFHMDNADPEILMKMISEDLHKVIPALYRAVRSKSKK